MTDRGKDRQTDRETHGLSRGRPKWSSGGQTHHYPSPNAARTRTQAAANRCPKPTRQRSGRNERTGRGLAGFHYQSLLAGAQGPHSHLLYAAGVSASCNLHLLVSVSIYLSLSPTNVPQLTNVELR